MNTGMRPFAISCVLLYVIVGFVAGACPASDGQTVHHHHQKPAAHALACAWACHASAHQGVVEGSTHILLVWLALTSLLVAVITVPSIRLILITARPPPRFSI